MWPLLTRPSFPTNPPTYPVKHTWKWKTYEYKEQRTDRLDGGDENAGGGDGDFNKEEERALEPQKNTNTNTK